MIAKEVLTVYELCENVFQKRLSEYHPDAPARAWKMDVEFETPFQYDADQDEDEEENADEGPTGKEDDAAGDGSNAGLGGTCPLLADGEPLTRGARTSAAVVSFANISKQVNRLISRSPPRKKRKTNNGKSSSCTV